MQRLQRSKAAARWWERRFPRKPPRCPKRSSRPISALRLWMEGLAKRSIRPGYRLTRRSAFLSTPTPTPPKIPSYSGMAAYAPRSNALYERMRAAHRGALIGMQNELLRQADRYVLAI